jgi:hypothetical protein
MNTLDEVAQRLKLLQANQELTMEMIRHILEELGLRKSIAKLEAQMEENYGSLAPASMDISGE